MMVETAARTNVDTSGRLGSRSRDRVPTPGAASRHELTGFRRRRSERARYSLPVRGVVQLGRSRQGVVLKDRTSTYRDGSRAGWHKVKDPSWIDREAWRFDRR
jgi:hypothetical protein